MMRWSVLIAGTVVATGAAFVAGAAFPTKSVAVEEALTADPKPPVVIGQKTGYFNMTRVMRECKLAKTSVERLNARKTRLAANLVALKARHDELQAAVLKTKDANKKFDLEQEAIGVARRIEDLDRDIKKMLNERASLILTELYDELHAVVAAVASENHLAIVYAYPDGATLEEQESPYMKELKLKPPAAQPFRLDPSAEYTDEIIRRMNDKFNGADN